MERSPESYVLEYIGTVLAASNVPDATKLEVIRVMSERFKPVEPKEVIKTVVKAGSVVISLIEGERGNFIRLEDVRSKDNEPTKYNTFIDPRWSFIDPRRNR